jgi:hypothetical protein
MGEWVYEFLQFLKILCGFVLPFRGVRGMKQKVFPAIFHTD